MPLLDGVRSLLARKLPEDAQAFALLGESVARRYLERRGYLTLAARFHTKVGEIDLVMQDGETVVFVEVKTRRSLAAGEPEEAVTREKIEHLVAAAHVYLKARRIAHRQVRLDVVSVTYKKGGRPRVRHHQAIGDLRARA